MSPWSPSYRHRMAGKYGPPEVRLLSLGIRGKPTKDEVFDIIDEKHLDVFRNTPIFRIYFSNIDFGDIDSANLKAFAKAQRNMDDQIFATDREVQLR